MIRDSEEAWEIGEALCLESKQNMKHNNYIEFAPASGL